VKEEEFSDFSEEESIGIGAYLAILKRRKKQFFIPVVVILILSAILARVLPSVYRSEATILIEQQEIPSELVRTTVTSYAGERIKAIEQRVMTSGNLEKIIKKYGLYEEDREKTSMISLVSRMRSDISLEMVSAEVVDPRSGRPTTATIAFKLLFESSMAKMARNVTNELVSLYLNENLKQRERSAVETSDFLASEASKLNKMVKNFEKELAAFKEINYHNLPELQQLNLQMMERSDRELTETNQQIKNVEERIIYLKSELVQISPTSVAYTSTGQRIYSAEDRLKELQTQYVTLSTRYTDNHPSVKKVKEEIKALKAELKAESASREESITTLDDNPAYIQLQTQLQAAELELRSLKTNQTKIEKKVKDYEGRLVQSPQVEREYKNLSRDYENALEKYREVKAKQLEAELSESLEREKKGERFTLIEPAEEPESPARPNRVAIFFIGFVFSFLGGIGHVALREGLDDTVHGIKGITDIAKTPPLAVIPNIKAKPVMLMNFSFGDKKIIILSLIAGVFLTLILIHNFYKPLDVITYVILRAVGIDAADG
jgi:polysaccharide chain length determinant protein (PEP-CTERM system associated)